MDPLVLSDNRHLPRCTELNGAPTLRWAARGKPAIKRKLSKMRHAKNFHPEWDHVPVANRFLIAMAIGAIAGGGVVLSLADVSTGQASVAAHVLAAPAQALLGAPEAAQPHAQSVVESALDSGTDDRLGAAVNGTNPKIVEPAGIAKALTEAGPNDASVNVATPPSSTAAPAENKTTKNRRVARHVEPRVARGGYGAWGWGGSASHLY